MCVHKCFPRVSIVFFLLLVLLSTATYLCSAYYAEGIKGIKGKSYQSPSTSSSSSSSSSYGGITIKKPSSQSNYVQQRSSSQNLISTSTMGSKKMSPIEMMIFGPSDVKGSSSYGGGNSMSSFSSINSGAGIGGSGSGYKSSMMTLSPFQSNLMDYGSGSAGGIGSNYQQQQQSQGPVSAAIQSKHSVQYIDVPYESTPIAPQTILVEANRIPLNIFFQSRSSNLNVETEHTPSPGSTQETSSEDEPHYLIHQIKPVEEDIQTIIARQIPSDNKYVPMNGQYKGGSPTTSPITIRPGSPIQQQTEIYQDTGSSFSGSGGYQSSQLKPNTISYVRPREPNSNDAELFLNAIRNEVGRIKSQSQSQSNDYKTQSTAIRSATYTLNPYHLSATRQAATTNDDSDLDNEHDDEHQINPENEPKIRSYRYQPTTNGRKLSDTSAYVTTLLPMTSSLSTSSENSPQIGITPTTASSSSSSSASDVSTSDDDNGDTSSSSSSSQYHPI
ncbi:hypothetical protein DERF_015016 [Dermatophagoides farinae]|uniref:DFP2 n=1 Tax=Dermatophagoides farinae TaxID=6954 RepID=A0A922KU75_DERFA|nr:hypothetical protein DERF_015016 [Dermatophagoides farinae]